MHNLAPLLCHLLRNTPIQNRLSFNIKMKRLCVTSRSQPQPMIGCCSISDGDNKNNTKGGEEDGSPAGGTLREYTSLTRRNEKEGEAIKGTGGDKEVAGVITYPTADTDGGRGGTLNLKEEASHIRPNIGRKVPCKEFQRRD